MKVYLVGGAVRDMLLDRPVKDRDWVVVGATPQEMLDAGFTQVGADFPVFLHPETKEEYALARTERKTGHGYHGFVTIHDHTVTLDEDLKRRDLTINAMAIAEEDLHAFQTTKDLTFLFDPFDGRLDLQQGMLRHVSDAFAEDPLRILRVARFAARYNFSLAPQTNTLMRKMARDGELAHLAVERIWTEFEKAIMEPYAHRFFAVLQSVDALVKALPFFGVARYEQVYLPCTAFNGEMAARHRAAAILIVCLCHAATPERQYERDSYYKLCRVPKDVWKLVEQWMTIANRSTAVPSRQPQWWLKALKDAGLYREPGMAEEIAKVTIALPGTEGIVKQLIAALHVSKDVSFADLTDEQKATLRGPAVGEAIDELRLERLRKLSFREQLRG